MIKIPSIITAGTTLKFSGSLPCHPASEGWEATLHMRGAGNIDITATNDGDLYRFEVEAGTLEPPSGTSPWVAGGYIYSLRVRKDGEVNEICTGNITVKPNLLAPDADPRSEVKKTLDAINAVIAKRATKDQERYVIEVNGSRRELWRTPIGDLLKLRDRYQMEYNMELRAKKGKNLFGPTVRVRM